MKIVIRVDGGSNIGMGHIHRCLALSSQLKKNGAEILFISKKDEAVKKKVKQEGFEVITLRDNIDLKDDLESTINVIKAYRADIVITDSYTIDEYYLTEIKKIASFLVSIDDLAKISFVSDIVINQNIYAKELDYHSSIGRTKFLLGPQYALLREEFSNLGKRKINKKVKNTLITLGGNDSFDLTPKILKILDRINQNFEITVAVSPFFKNIREIEKTTKEMGKKVELIYDSHKMSGIMLASDLAVTGGGTTLYELAATGTPTFSFCLADNQEQNVRSLANYGILVSLGWNNKVNEIELKESVVNLMDDFHLRQEMAKLGQALVDGNGTKRICSIIRNEN